MITHNDIKADLHVHTIASCHGFSTVLENMTYGIQAGMEYIAVTDHYYCHGSTIDIMNEAHRMISVNRCSDRYMGMTVINGAEFNFGAADSVLACKDILNRVRWKLLGLHDWFLKKPIPSYTMKDITKILFETVYDMSDGVYPTAIAHIERGLKDTNDFSKDTLIKVMQNVLIFAKDNDLYMEVNESSAKNKDLQDIMRIWIKMAKENGNKICLGSDAHFALHVGIFDNAITLLNEVDYPKELILNCNRTALNQFCK